MTAGTGCLSSDYGPLGPDSALCQDTLLDRAQRTLSTEPRPFLRWAGSKQRLLRQLVPHLPKSYGTYYEPFLGSGALFFLLRPTVANLNDKCSPLVETYHSVSEDPYSLLDLLQDRNVLDKDAYYRARDEDPTNKIARAALFIYLNRAGWNGLYRVNSQGKFNVPYGAPKSANVIDKSNLLSCGELLQSPGISISCDDYEVAAERAGSGDLVFFDPPYVTGHNNNGFVDYNETLFSWADQVRLAELASTLKDKGAHVMITNAYHDAVRALYPDFELHPLVRNSTLASHGGARGQVREALFVGRK